MKVIRATIKLFGFIMRTSRSLNTRIQSSWDQKAYWGFGLSLMSALMFYGLVVLVVYGICGFFSFIAAEMKKDTGAFVFLLFIIVVALPDILGFIKNLNPQPEPQVYENIESKQEAYITYENIIHPNMLLVLIELSKYHPIYEPTRSSILPPSANDGLTDKISHWLFEVRAKMKHDLSEDEVDKIETATQDTINQKLKAHQLVNLDTEWVQDGKGASHPKLMIDSVIVAQDNLLIYVAVTSENYLNYKLANPRRSKRRQPLFDDLFNNL